MRKEISIWSLLVLSHGITIAINPPHPTRNSPCLRRAVNFWNSRPAL